MLHEGLLLVLDRRLHRPIHDRALKLKLLHDALHGFALLLDVGQVPVGVLQLRILPLDLRRQHGVQALLVVQALFEILGLAIELVPLLDCSLAGDSRDLPLHQLGLEVHGVQQFLLPLPFLVQPANLELQVLYGRLRPANLAERVGLLRAQLVEFLTLLVQHLLRTLHLLLDRLECVQHVLAGPLDILAPLVFVLSLAHCELKPSLVGLELLLHVRRLLLAELQVP
mmetsp:Transcript_36800/g.104784  ORF Transcript_36800/g.104784 Transcript_36800/m.104784 type:complete len:226 (-) Transcript_36800:1107-1784(-)